MKQTLPTQLAPHPNPPMCIRSLSVGLTAAVLSCLTAAALHADDPRETPLVKAVRRAAPSVVNIHTEKTSQDRDGYGQGRKISGMGTGIIVDERGYIVTNQHVIANVDSVRVTIIDPNLQERSTYEGQVITQDTKHDLAIMKINPKKPLPVAPMGTSSDIMLGETVIAIGNAFGYEHTISAGIVSALHRDVEVNEKQAYKNLVQTDAAINPGNSGGPLINLDGNVVAINVAIRAGAQKIGFAIPIDDARVLIARLLSIRKLNSTYHGLLARDVKSAKERLMVVNGAEADSPAAKAGFLAGDVVVQVRSALVQDQADFERAFLDTHPGDKVDVVVRREGRDLPLSVEIARLVVGQKAGQAPTVTAAVPAQTVTRANNNDEFSDRLWQLLGLRLAKLPAQQVKSLQTRYRGGMQVLEVRANSPAAKHGIAQGDILVGLHEWETLNADNVSYVLNHPEFSSFNPLKFYVLRNAQPLFGYLQLGN